MIGEAGKVAGGIRISASKRDLSHNQSKTAEKCANYISNHKEFTNYQEYLAQGFPIATGVIEGACRYLIKDRMDITGARWGLYGAESVLKLRSLVSSDDFEEYWKYHLEQEYERNYSSKIRDISKIIKDRSSF